MKRVEVKVTRIGNSRGIRMEERSDGIMLRPAGPVVEKLSWEDTARAMAASAEDWREWDTTTADGLDSLPWDPGASPLVSERKTPYKTNSRLYRKR
jgi:hypothetical protein